LAPLTVGYAVSVSNTVLSAGLTHSVPAPRPPGMTIEPGHPVPAGSPFPLIAGYGFLSDCEVCALVASSGAIEWMCLSSRSSTRSCT